MARIRINDLNDGALDNESMKALHGGHKLYVPHTAFVPSKINYIRGSKTSEAETGLNSISGGAAEQYEDENQGQTQDKSMSGPTPSGGTTIYQSASSSFNFDLI